MAWDYLQDPVLEVRQRIAAHFLREQENIIEIGAFKTPITPYLLKAPKEVVIVDPLIEPGEWKEWNGKPANIRHLRMGMEDLDLNYFGNRPYGLLFCGVDLGPLYGEPVRLLKAVCHFLCLLSNADVPVIEYAMNWAPPAKLFQLILSVLQPRIAADMKLDLTRSVSGKDVTEEIRQRFLRRMIVLADMDRVKDPKVIQERVARILFGTEASAHLLSATAQSMRTVLDGLDISKVRRANDAAKVETQGGVVCLTTPARAWNYGAVIPLGTSVLTAIKSGSPVPAAVEIELEVEAGEVGVGMLADDFQQITGERMVRSETGRQTVQLFIPDLRGHTGLLFRNGDRQDAASAKIHRATISLP